MASGGGAGVCGRGGERGLTCGGGGGGGGGDRSRDLALAAGLETGLFASSLYPPDLLDVPAEATLLLEESRSLSKDLLTSAMMSSSLLFLKAYIRHWIAA